MNILQNKDGISANQAERLYNLDYNGWISSCTRNSLLWGKCVGNNEHEHFFNYFGTPDTYKVIIINNDTGEIKITDIINKIDYNSKISIDYENMFVSNDISNASRNASAIISKIFPIIIPAIITIVVEVIILFCFQMERKNNVKTVIITNLISNLLLQILLILINNIPEITGIVSINCFFILEILILIIELSIYKMKFEEKSKKKIIVYTIIANLISGFLTMNNLL